MLVNRGSFYSALKPSNYENFYKVLNFLFLSCPWASSILADVVFFFFVFSLLLQESNRYLSHVVHRSDVIAAWSGIRPLVRDPKLSDQEGTKVRASCYVLL